MTFKVKFWIAAVLIMGVLFVSAKNKYNIREKVIDTQVALVNDNIKLAKKVEIIADQKQVLTVSNAVLKDSLAEAGELALKKKDTLFIKVNATKKAMNNLKVSDAAELQEVISNAVASDTSKVEVTVVNN